MRSALVRLGFIPSIDALSYYLKTDNRITCSIDRDGLLSYWVRTDEANGRRFNFCGNAHNECEARAEFVSLMERMMAGEYG